MKRYIAFLCILTIVKTTNLSAQIVDTASWAPPGATWIYNTVSGFGQDIFYQLQYVSDTTLLGINAKHILVSNIKYVGPGPGFANMTRSEYPIGDQYMYESHDTIYWLLKGEFRFLYNFNATIGDKWLITGDTDSYKCASLPNDTEFITQISNLTFDNHTFFAINGDHDTIWQEGIVLKNLGSFNNPFPIPKCYINLGVGTYPQQLLCYHDSVRGWIDFGSGGYCYGIATSIVDVQTSNINDYVIYPNPSTGHIYIKSTGNQIYEVTIYDIVGNTLYIGTGDETGIDVSTYPTGIYICQINTSSGRQSFIKFIKL